MNPNEQLKESYFGSVRFFKHMILLVYALLIVIPLALCIVFGMQRSELRRSVARLDAELRAAELQMEELQSLPLSAEEPPETQEPPDPVEPDEPPAAAEPGEHPEYEELYPELYAPREIGERIYASDTVYLTFDDGPSSRTDEILAVLERYGVKATFFVVGRTDEAGKQRLRHIAEAGHAIGMHTYSHSYEKIYGSVEAFLEDMDKIYHLIGETTGEYPGIFRFPGGSINGYNGPIYQEMISEMTRRGFVYFDWNVTNGDGESGTKSVKETETLAKKGIGYKRPMILMHDNANRPNTVAALPGIIEAYRDAGYTFDVLTPEIVPVHYGY